MHNFRRCIINTAIFLVLVLVLCLFVPVFYFEGGIAANAGKNFDVKERQSYAGSVDTIFSGASHGLCGFRPSVYDEAMDTSSYNLSGSLLTMQGRYTLIQQELSRNPVETVILEVSYNALSRTDTTHFEGDYYMIGRIDRLSDRLKWIGSSFSYDEYFDLYATALKDGRPYLIHRMKGLLVGAGEQEDWNPDRGFLPSDPKDLTLSQEAYRQEYHTVPMSTEINQENLEYLNRILALCQQKGARVILVTLPLSQLALNRYDNLETVRLQYAQLAQENGCLFWDFNLYKERTALLSDTDCFRDINHMSTKGAGAFTRLLADTLSAYDGGQDVSGWFYGSYDELPRVGADG